MGQSESRDASCSESSEPKQLSLSEQIRMMSSLCRKERCQEHLEHRIDTELVCATTIYLDYTVIVQWDVDLSTAYYIHTHYIENRTTLFMCRCKLLRNCMLEVTLLWFGDLRED